MHKKEKIVHTKYKIEKSRIKILKKERKITLNKKETKISKEIKINKKSARRNYSNQTGITLIALVVTIIIHCDKTIKYSNNNGFLLSRI